MKSKLKKSAINFRKKGMSYSEILKEIPVAKSTLSLWLRKVGLSTKQLQRFTEKKRMAAKRGGLTRKIQRIETTKRIKRKAFDEIKNITLKELQLMGIILYWAEGARIKENSLSQGIIFSNSDPRLIKLFLKWLKEIIKIPKEQIYFDIYINEIFRNKCEEVKRYWASVTGFSTIKTAKIYYKRNNSSKIRKRTDNYFGLLRIRVRKSSWLNRKIEGWKEGICFQCRVV